MYKSTSTKQNRAFTVHSPWWALRPGMAFLLNFLFFLELCQLRFLLTLRRTNLLELGAPPSNFLEEALYKCSIWMNDEWILSTLHMASRLLSIIISYKLQLTFRCPWGHVRNVINANIVNNNNVWKCQSMRDGELCGISLRKEKSITETLEVGLIRSCNSIECAKDSSALWVQSVNQSNIRLLTRRITCLTQTGFTEELRVGRYE